MTLNGLDPDTFPPLAFIDLDGVVFKEMTNDWVADNTADLLKDYIRAGWYLIFWSSGMTPARAAIIRDALGPHADRADFVQKPLAASYCYIDDRLTPDLCHTKLLPPVSPTTAPAWRKDTQ